MTGIGVCTKRRTFCIKIPSSCSNHSITPSNSQTEDRFASATVIPPESNSKSFSPATIVAMAPSLPVSSSVPQGVCLRTVVMSLLLSLTGLLWNGVADAHALPAQSYKLSDTRYSTQANDLSSTTIPNDYDLKSFLLGRLRQSLNMHLYEKHSTGSKSTIHKREISDAELVDQLLIILKRLQNQREANTALTMPSLRFR